MLTFPTKSPIVLQLYYLLVILSMASPLRLCFNNGTLSNNSFPLAISPCINKLALTLCTFGIIIITGHLIGCLWKWFCHCVSQSISISLYYISTTTQYLYLEKILGKYILFVSNSYHEEYSLLQMIRILSPNLTNYDDDIGRCACIDIDSL